MAHVERSLLAHVVAKADSLFARYRDLDLVDLQHSDVLLPSLTDRASCSWSTIHVGFTIPVHERKRHKSHAAPKYIDTI
jgi:hypothetical protein